jgi:hypothetical protein
MTNPHRGYRKRNCWPYGDGPMGRIDAADVIKFFNFREAQHK